MSFGTKLKTYRLRYGMNQKTLAERIGIHPEHLGAIEREEVNPPKTRTIGRIIKVLHLTSEEATDLISAAFE